MKRHRAGTMLFLGACALVTFYLNVKAEDKKVGSVSLRLISFAATHWIYACVMILHHSTSWSLL